MHHPGGEYVTNSVVGLKKKKNKKGRLRINLNKKRWFPEIWQGTQKDKQNNIMY